MYNYLRPVDDGLLMRSSGPWAAEKLDYLRRYIDVFETSMRKKWGLRNYIDLMSGPGKNRVRETDQVLLGSPLLALTTDHPFTGYYFVDLDKENTDVLAERCSASQAGVVQITTGDCNQEVAAIVDELKRNQSQSMNLAFLDPQGLELQWRTVAKLASMWKMDLIINYPQGGLNRAMGPAFENDGDSAVDLYFGDREWRTTYEAWLPHRRPGLHRQLIDLYLSNLQKLGYVEVRRDDEVGDEPLMRNAKKRAPLYRLLFASKHELGKKFWHDITGRDVHGQMRLLDAD